MGTDRWHPPVVPDFCSIELTISDLIPAGSKPFPLGGGRYAVSREDFEKLVATINATPPSCGLAVTYGECGRLGCGNPGVWADPCGVSWCAEHLDCGLYDGTSAREEK